MSTTVQQATIVEYVDPTTLKAHPRSIAIYGSDGYVDLVPSIKELGVLQALYCKRDRTVVSGHRRWKAALEARCAVVPVIWVSYASELDERQAIIEHNRYRVKNGQQFYNEGKEVEAIEAARAKQRQATSTGGLSPQLMENLPQAEGTTRDAVAQAIGLGSGRQWDKLVYVAGHKPELLPEIKTHGLSIDGAFRQTRLEAVKALAPPPLPPGVFDVIYADPPWCYDNRIMEWGPAELHYPTMSLEELMARKPTTADDAVLFLWVTNPMLSDALRLVEAWGFQYKTNMVWVKRDLQRPGSGFYVRGRHELLFICTRGSFVPDQVGKEPIGSVIEAPVGKHSAKPLVVYEVIERMYPGRKYLELFLRGKARPGWEGWGNEH